MATLRDYFVSESADYMGRLNELFNQLDVSRGDPTELHRIAKAWRGSAQLAREPRVYRAGLGLESASKALVAGTLQWSADISGRARRTVEDLDALTHAGEGDDMADGRVKRVLERWREVGVALPEEATAGASTGGERSHASKQFREFAAHEVAGIASEIEASLTQLSQDPRNRDVLKAILRRQRALLGSARLDEIGVVAETLRAIEDLVRVIAKLNVAVKDEWAAVFRAARDVLSAALDPLRQGNDPSASPALSKLRTLRTELLERFGEGDVVPVAGPSHAAPTFSPPAPPAQPAAPPKAAAPPAAPPTPAVPAANGIVPINELCYSGERALRRALELRGQLETMAGDDADKRDDVDEVFDLIRLGIG